MPSVWQALKRGESARQRRLEVARAHELFLAVRDNIAHSPEARRKFVAETGLRDVVVDSWLRADAFELDPDRTPDGLILTVQQIRDARAAQPIGEVIPIVERLLLEQAHDAGFIVAVGDASGRLLWVDGNHRLRADAEAMGFVAGMDWSEAAVGTSAPGSALELNHGIQVLGAEHFNRSVHQWSCTAAPIHDPVTGSLMGVIDVTGGDELASPHVMPMVEATLAAVSAELRLERIRRELGRGDRVAGQTIASPQRRAAPMKPRLILLGRDPAILEVGAERHEVSGRHAEILLTLAQHRGGLSASELVAHVYGDGGSTQTLRAEIVRLRRWLDDTAVPIRIASRPYLLADPIDVDAFQALAALGRGAHRIALAAYEGPALPGSDAPSVRAVRDDVDATLREAMLQDAAPDALYGYAQQWARSDVAVWETLLRVLPPLSPKRAHVVARLDALSA